MAQLAPNFTAKIEDEYGVYPEAIVAIGKVYKKNEELTTYNDDSGECKQELVISNFAYEVMYYNSRDAVISGKRSRPIIVSSSGEPSRVIVANLDDEDIKHLISSGLAGEQLNIQIIEIDIRKRFI